MIIYRIIYRWPWENLGKGDAAIFSRHVHVLSPLVQDPTMLFLDEPTSGAAAAPAKLVLTEWILCFVYGKDLEVVFYSQWGW